MGYTIGTYPGEIKKSLPSSSSPVLTAHQGASSRVLKGHPGRLIATFQFSTKSQNFTNEYVLDLFF